MVAWVKVKTTGSASGIMQRYRQKLLNPMRDSMKSLAAEGERAARNFCPYDRFNPGQETHIRDFITSKVGSGGQCFQVYSSERESSWANRRQWLHEIGSGGHHVGVAPFPAYVIPIKKKYLHWHEKGSNGFYRDYDNRGGRQTPQRHWTTAAHWDRPGHDDTGFWNTSGVNLKVKAKHFYERSLKHVEHLMQSEAGRIDAGARP